MKSFKTRLLPFLCNNLAVFAAGCLYKAGTHID